MTIPSFTPFYSFNLSEHTAMYIYTLFFILSLIALNVNVQVGWLAKKGDLFTEYAESWWRKIKKVFRYI